MNNRKEKIVEYLDGRMGESGKLRFEEEMAGDPALRIETERLKAYLEGLRAGAEPDTDDNYFINMLPEFYARKSGKKKFILSKLAYSVSTAAAVIIILFIVFKPSGKIDSTNLADLKLNITDSELNEALNQYSDQFTVDDLMNTATAKTDSIVSNMVADELNISGPIDRNFADNYVDTDELLSSINETEANQLYSQLINVDFIKGVK